MSAPLQTVASDVRRISSQQKTMSTTDVDIVHPPVKSLLIQGRRHALSDLVNNSCSAGVLSEKTSCVDQRPLPTGCSSADGTKLRLVEVHSAIARTCLNVPSPEPVMPIPQDITQSPEEKAGNLSMEVMHNKLDISDELSVLSEEPLPVADDAREDSLLSSITAPSMDNLAQGLSSPLELEFGKLQCDTPEWLETVPDVSLPELELTVVKGFYDLPEEFKLEDKHFEVFRNVCGVRFPQKHSMAVIPLTPPEFALPAALDSGYVEDDTVDLEASDTPIPLDQLQFVPLE
ncbi:hypothetical protein HPB50_019829 [Hyalomma asiaticum]|uniref:Uncharacterized protein n=1 Tax=Hyalomma asiaticum TaxID=266040 RepID=A0ACB7RVV5_HYAAI|nr:hypothetical protein HPB50_019829 [Hyalomma asiaticum]